MRDLEGVTRYGMQAWTALIGVGPLLGLSLWLEPGGFASLGTLGWVPWFGIGYAAIAASLVGHGIYYSLIQRHPVAKVMPWLLLTPLLAMALGIAFFGDRPGPKLWLGGAMVLGGILVIALRTQAKQRPAPVAEDL